MNKTILLAVFVFLSRYGWSQETSVAKSYKFNSGFTIKTGDTLIVGAPSSDEGYKYVHVKGEAIRSEDKYFLIKNIVKHKYDGFTDIELNGWLNGEKCKIEMYNAVKSGELLVLADLRNNEEFAEFPKINDDTLYVTDNVYFTKGSDIELGVGTMPNGDFKYITSSRGNWLTAMGESDILHIGSKWSGHKFLVKDFYQYGTNQRGYVFYLKLGGGNIINYECDIKNALRFGEVIHKDYAISNGNPTIIQQQLSPADEIKKLHGLYKDGILSEEEYNSAKQKLLNSK